VAVRWGDCRARVRGDFWPKAPPPGVTSTPFWLHTIGSCSTCLLSSAFTPVFWRMAERPCLKVMLARPTQENERKIPREIEGYPVVTEISGEIRPLRP